MSTRRAVRKRVRECAAREERRRIQRREKLFKSGASGRFRLPQKRKKSCSRLVKDGSIISDKGEMLETWAGHFGGLASSRLDVGEGGRGHSEEMEALLERMKSAFWMLPSLLRRWSIHCSD